MCVWKHAIKSHIQQRRFVSLLCWIWFQVIKDYCKRAENAKMLLYFNSMIYVGKFVG